MWALMSAPLILSADIRGTTASNTVTPAMRAVLLNPDIIAIDQVGCSTIASAVVASDSCTAAARVTIATG
jgi:hypothetical protein